MKKNLIDKNDFFIVKEDSNFRKFRKILGFAIFFTYAFTIFYALIKLLSASEDSGFLMYGQRSMENYIMVILKQLFGILVLLLPSFLNKRFNMVLPDLTLILFYIFIFSALFLGEVRGFYSRFSIFDDFLHLTSGMLLTMLGFFLIEVINKKRFEDLNISPLFASMFAIGFAIFCGNIWELYEYIVDGLFDMNLQRYAEYSGEIRIGRRALVDTMNDLIVNLFGASLTGVMGYRILKKELNKNNY